MKRAILSAIVILCTATGLAHANWTATGTFRYVDREYDHTGFTGVETPLPVREADIEIVDANASPRNTVIATGRTDQNGGYSILVSDNSTRSVYVRVLTRSNSTAGLYIDVRESTSNKPKFYAAATPTVTGHSPTANVDFGIGIIGIGQGGEAFNIYDQLLTGVDYVAFLAGSRPGSASPLRAIWGPLNGVGGSFYTIGSGSITLRDTAGYDDTPILHEMGHYVTDFYSDMDSPGYSHTFTECDQDNRQSFDEGFASYWGNSALRFRGLPHCNIYTRTTGAPGPGNLVRYADLEDDQQYNCLGSTSEVNVFLLLWDIVDGSSTTDATPGMDDPHDLIDTPDSEVWEVMTGPVAAANFATLESFWNGWFSPPLQNGHRLEMIDLAEPLTIEYFEDPREVNDSPPLATPVTTDGSTIHASFFRDPDLDGAGSADLDLYSLSASQGQLYVLETRNLLSDGNTRLVLLDTNGSTVLAINSDRSTSDESSRIDWTAPRTDLFYAQVEHQVEIGIHGSYDFLITAQSPVDNDQDGYDTTVDCNDGDPAINPAAVEVCDGSDQDCDSAVDEDFDVDLDTYTTCNGDCNDASPGVNPGASEVPANGIDDNCNGETDEQPQTDTVTITRAEWKKGPKKLFVEATSSQQPGVTLNVVGFGQMSFDANLNRYVYQSAGGIPKPGTVTVESSGGGSDTAVVP